MDYLVIVSDNNIIIEKIRFTYRDEALTIQSADASKVIL